MKPSTAGLNKYPLPPWRPSCVAAVRSKCCWTHQVSAPASPQHSLFFSMTSFLFQKRVLLGKNMFLFPLLGDSLATPLSQASAAGRNSSLPSRDYFLRALSRHLSCQHCELHVVRCVWTLRDLHVGASHLTASFCPHSCHPERRTPGPILCRRSCAWPIQPHEPQTRVPNPVTLAATKSFSTFVDCARRSDHGCLSSWNSVLPACSILQRGSASGAGSS